MNLLCIFGWHNWNNSYRTEPYETTYKKKVVRYIIRERVCKDCGIREIREVNFDTEDLDIQKNFKEKE